MKYVCMAIIRFYRRVISPLKPHPTCRFTPTCSTYALEAYEKRGFFAGFILSTWRLLRCSPLSPAGYDPVPEKGFRTMPMRFSKYDQWRAECQEAEQPTECNTETDKDTDGEES